MATEFTSERAGRGPGRKQALAATSEGRKLSDSGECGPQSREFYWPLGCRFLIASEPGLEKVTGAISWRPQQSLLHCISPDLGLLQVSDQLETWADTRRFL